MAIRVKRKKRKLISLSDWRKGPQIEAMIRHIKPQNIYCYVLVGFNSTREQDLSKTLSPALSREGRGSDYDNKRQPTQQEKDISRQGKPHVAFLVRRISSTMSHARASGVASILRYKDPLPARICRFGFPFRPPS